MKKLPFIFFLFLVHFSPAQDLIVTKANDSLNVKITNIKNNFLFYTFKDKEEIRNSLIRTDSVKKFSYNYYAISEVPSSIKGYREKGPPWRVAANIGLSFLLAPINPDATDLERKYINGLKSGNHCGVDCNYFFTDYLGAGICSDLFFSSNSANATIQLSTGASAMGILSDDINIFFIGPSVNLRFPSSSGMNVFFINLAVGYTGYSDEEKFISSSIITGSTAGVVFDIDYDIGLSGHTALGFALSYKTGTLTSVDVTTNGMKEHLALTKENYEQLARIEITIGLRLR